MWVATCLGAGAVDRNDGSCAGFRGGFGGSTESERRNANEESYFSSDDSETSPTHIRTHTNTHTHTHTHIFAHTHIHTQTRTQAAFGRGPCLGSGAFANHVNWPPLL